MKAADQLALQPSSEPADSTWIKASPQARKLAREHGIDLSKLHGSGPGGRIVERDVIEARELD